MAKSTPPDSGETTKLRRFAAGIAHEVNNHLGVIVGNTHLARKKIDDDHPAAQNLDEVRAAIEECRSLMLSVGNLGSDRQLNMRPKNLGTLFCNIMDTAIASSQKSISVDKQLDTTVPDAFIDLAFAVPILQDAVNAYIKPMNETANIRVECLRDDRQHHVVVRLSDDGPPLTEADANGFFQPFAKIPSRGNVGISMMRLLDLMERHGGYARASCSEKGGLCLELGFKTAVNESTDPQAARQKERRNLPRSRTTTTQLRDDGNPATEPAPTVLLCVADRAMSALISHALQANDALVIEPADVGTAVASAKAIASRLRMVIIESDATLVRSLRDAAPAAKIVVIDGNIDDADGILKTPFTRQTVSDLYRTLLS